MNLPTSTHHATRTVSFSSMKATDVINSSLHVRQCLRELAGMIGSVVGVISAEVLLDIVNNGFSSSANAFHGDALFDGVRLQMVRRCWLRDMTDMTDCLLNGDMDLVQYAGSYGTMVTPPLTDREEDSEARRACRVASSLCARLHCYKPGKKRCPTCLELGLGTTRFCSEVCLQKCWSTHDVQHKQAKAYLDQQQQRQQQGEIQKVNQTRGSTTMMMMMMMMMIPSQQKYHYARSMLMSLMAPAMLTSLR